MRRGRPRHDDILTPREWQVLDLLRGGLTNEQIADRLGISYDTAKFHVSEILGKLGVESRQEAAAWTGKPKVAFGFGLPAIFGKGIAASMPVKVVAGGAIVAGAVAFVLLALGVVLGNGEASLGKIAFVRDGNIWVQELPHGTPYQLTDDGDSSGPRWSPSGEWLLYTTNPVRDGRGYIAQYVVRADGTRERMLDSESPVAYWLPDEDDRLAYYGTDLSLVFENADGTGRDVFSLPIPSDTPEVQRHRWPGLEDDDRILFVEARFPEGVDPREVGADEATYYGIWVSKPDGTDAHPLVEANPRDDQRIFAVGLSVDGSQLLYGTLPALAKLGDTEDADVLGDVSIYAVAMDGGTPRKLFDTNLFISNPLVEDANDTGTAIVVGSGGASWSNKRIAVLAPDASDVTFLTGSDVAALSPAWSPDGEQIAYVAGPDLSPDERSEALNSRRVWVMDADGSNQRQLTFGEGIRDESPMWSADGKHILFARLRQGEYCDGDRYELWMYDLDDGTVTLVNDHLAMSTWVLDREDPSFVSLCRLSTPYQRDPQGSANTHQYLDWWQPGNLD